MRILLHVKRKIMLSMMAVICLTSCLEEYDLYVPSDKGYLSIDVLISTKDTLQYAYVRESYNSSPSQFLLEHINPSFRNDIYFKEVDCDVVLIDEEAKTEYIYDKIVDEIKSDSQDTVLVRAYYVLRNFTPIVGRTYTAKVTYKGKTYQSTQTVHKGPIIDKITFKPYSTLDENERYRTFVHITDPNPNETDYYFFVDIQDTGSLYRIFSQGYFVPYSILSDEGMTQTKEGIELSLGMGAEENQKFTGVRYLKYEIMSISKENYEFFEEMKKQLTNDGGVYTPCPVTPPTNFTGGKVVGQFIATDAQVYIIYPDESSIVK